MGEESERQGGGSGLIHTQPTAASPSSWPFGPGAHPVSEFWPKENSGASQLVPTVTRTNALVVTLTDVRALTVGQKQC
jgi:hypothetical protein